MEVMGMQGMTNRARRRPGSLGYGQDGHLYRLDPTPED